MLMICVPMGSAAELPEILLPELSIDRDSSWSQKFPSTRIPLPKLTLDKSLEPRFDDFEPKEASDRGAILDRPDRELGGASDLTNSVVSENAPPPAFDSIEGEPSGSAVDEPLADRERASLPSSSEDSAGQVGLSASTVDVGEQSISNEEHDRSLVPRSSIEGHDLMGDDLIPERSQSMLTNDDLSEVTYRWQVQLLAGRSLAMVEEDRRIFIGRYSDMLAGLTLRVSRSNYGDSRDEFFRLRVLDWSEEAKARDWCAKLRVRGHDCFVARVTAEDSSDIDQSPSIDPSTMPR
ncbi:hypothetical protein [Thiorhodococcus fuscus]|uniref:SPOR domain-containing protein n=1 Tax=Thiorhodococcus fuscus TaxID=527200 RepID=A0ABW4YE39_9GAMM